MLDTREEDVINDGFVTPEWYNTVQEQNLYMGENGLISFDQVIQADNILKYYRNDVR